MAKPRMLDHERGQILHALSARRKELIHRWTLFATDTEARVKYKGMLDLTAEDIRFTNDAQISLDRLIFGKGRTYRSNRKAVENVWNI